MSNGSVLYRLKIGQRIYILVGLLLLFILTIGGVGVYKMNVIGQEMEDIALRDIPLTKMLEKITVHQLEQAILMERALRFQGVKAHAEGETFESVAAHFEELAKKTDEEILQAETMAAGMIENAHSEEAREEFKHVLEELKKIETEHKDYEHHVFEIFKVIKDDGAAAALQSEELSEKVITVEHEQEDLDKHIEGLQDEVSSFTQFSMNKALADEQRGQNLILILSIIILVLGSALAFVLTRSVTGPLSNLTKSMTKLADGDMEAEIPSVRYQDEVNDMSQAMTVFQANMRRANTLEAEQAVLKKKQQQRQNELNQLVGIFGSTIGAVFSQILDSSRNMVGQAGNMLQQSNSSEEMASEVAAEAEKSAVNAQGLSAATEEMVASIQEITKQVTRSSEVTKEAVEFSLASQKEVQQLQDISEEIGAVVQLITDIAEQTNLLALNATIEAARAGEAGKGFAVVANEVKSLASQTSRATEEISLKIQSIQAASDQSADSIGRIGKVISDIDQYITAIVAAVEEQNAVTKEIARNVDFVSQSSERVSESVQKIKTQSVEVGQSSQDVNTNADRMATEADTISKEVSTFLGAMQNSDADDDMYEPRKISVRVSAQVNGGNWSGQASEITAAHVVVSPAIAADAGQKLELSFDGLDEVISARIAKNEGGNTIVQFPLDFDHMEKMKRHIVKFG